MIIANVRLLLQASYKAAIVCVSAIHCCRLAYSPRLKFTSSTPRGELLYATPPQPAFLQTLCGMEIVQKTQSRYEVSFPPEKSARNNNAMEQSPAARNSPLMGNRSDEEVPIDNAIHASPHLPLHSLLVFAPSQRRAFPH